MKGNMVIKDKVVHIDKSSMYKNNFGTLDFIKNPPEYISKSLEEILEGEDDNEHRT